MSDNNLATAKTIDAFDEIGEAQQMRPMKVLGTLCLCGLALACGARTSLVENLNESSQGGGGSSSSRGSSSFHGSSSSFSSSSVGGQGSCSDAVLAHDAKGASALAVDGDAVFWGTVDGQVWKSESGGAPFQLAAAATTVGALDVDASSVYYIDLSTLEKVSRSGGPPTPIPTAPLEAIVLKVDAEAIYVLDTAGGLLSGSVLRVSHGGDTQEILTGLDTSNGLAIDNDNVYVVSQFAQVNGQGLNGVLLSVPKTGGDVTVLASNLQNPQGVVVFGNDLYFLEQTNSDGLGGAVRRMAKSGGALEMLGSTLDSFPLDIAVDQSGIYVTSVVYPANGVAGILYHMGLDGSGLTTLASTAGVQFGALRTNPSSIFWTSVWSSPPPDKPSVRKQCK